MKSFLGTLKPDDFQKSGKKLAEINIPGEKEMKTEAQFIQFRMNKTAYEHFRQKYPNTTSRFLKRCIYKALDDPEFIRDIIFNVKLPETEKERHGGN